VDRLSNGPKSKSSVLNHLDGRQELVICYRGMVGFHCRAEKRLTRSPSKSVEVPAPSRRLSMGRKVSLRVRLTDRNTILRCCTFSCPSRDQITETVTARCYVYRTRGITLISGGVLTAFANLSPRLETCELRCVLSDCRFLEVAAVEVH
jgi:hypothetical protein